MAKEKKDASGKAKIKPSISGLVGKKLKDISCIDGTATLYFTNGFCLKIKGDISFVVEESSS